MKSLYLPNWSVVVLIIVATITSLGCGTSGPNTPEDPVVNSSDARPSVNNNTADSKAAATPSPQAASSETGREVKPVDGAKLTMITPTEEVVLGGKLNEIAATLAKPEFPANAKETGIVTVEVLVNEKGEVRVAAAVSGPLELREAAIEAARATKFPPPLKDGKPVKLGGILTFERK